jgi:hypothetical protein
VVVEEEDEEPVGPAPTTTEMIATCKRALAEEMRDDQWQFAIPKAQVLRVLTDVLKLEKADEVPDNVRTFTVFVPTIAETYRDDAPALPAPEKKPNE